jgi:hypothetical protein
VKSFKLIMASIFGMLGLSLGAYGQSYGYQVFAPTTMTASSTSNYTHTIDVRRQATVALSLAGVSGGAGTDNLTLTFAPSVDGVNFTTAANSRITWVVAATGATPHVHSTNITVGGYGYLRLVSVQNGVAQTYAYTLTASNKGL